MPHNRRGLAGTSTFHSKKFAQLVEQFEDSARRTDAALNAGNCIRAFEHYKDVMTAVAQMDAHVDSTNLEQFKIMDSARGDRVVLSNDFKQACLVVNPRGAIFR